MIEENEKLIARFINGETSEEENQKVLELCEKDKDFLKELTESRETNRLLECLDTDDSFSEEVIARLQNQPLDLTDAVIDQLADKNVKAGKSSFLFFISSIAAILIIGFIIFLPQNDIAEVDETLAVTWKNKELSVGQKLKKGPLAITEGIAKIKFDDSYIIMEGPAKINLIDENTIEVIHGKVTAVLGNKELTVKSSRFTVKQANAEFAINAPKGEAPEIHAINGDINFKTNQLPLKKSEAAVFTSSGESRHKAKPENFITNLPPSRTDGMKYYYWSFDEGEGSSAKETGNDSENIYNGTLKGFKANGPKPQWIKGKFGKAVSLEGINSYIKTDFKGISGGNSRSVAFWVKIPKDAKTKNGYGIISWGSFKKYGATWQISYNPEKTQGPLGRLRVGTHSGQIIGTTDLRDDQWHHVAIVMYGEGKPNVSTHILIYIDGKLERTSTKSIRDINTDTTSPESRNVNFGKNAAYIGQRTQKNRFFKGSLDEVYLFNQALNPEEVKKLYHNKPLFDK